MKSVTDLTLRLLALGALDPDQAARIEDRLAASPELRARLAALSPLGPAPPTSPWNLPPPGFGWGVARGEARIAAPVLDARPGGPVPLGERLRLALPSGHDAHHLVLLTRVHGTWGVATTLRVQDLPRVEGQPVLDLQATLPLGPHIVALALWPADQDLGSPPTWQPLQEALAKGDVPVITVAFEVVSPWADEE